MAVLAYGLPLEAEAQAELALVNALACQVAISIYAAVKCHKVTTICDPTGKRIDGACVTNGIVESVRAEVRRVREVERLGPELYVHLLFYREITEYSEVPVKHTWAAQIIEAIVTE